MKLITTVIITSSLLATGCSTANLRIPDAVLINGASTHVNRDKDSNHNNYGIGVEYGVYSANVVRNSRTQHGSKSYSLTRDLYKHGDFTASAGAAVYDDAGHYDTMVKPIAKATYRIADAVDVSYIAPDIIATNLVIPLGK